MDVILLERVRHLGQMGEVVKVKPGYARNFLLPQGKALRASKDNIAHFEAQKAELEARNEEARQAAQGEASKIEGLRITLIRQASETGHLYGSVSARDVAGAVTESGYAISHGQVILDRPIKMLGLHDVLVHLHPEVEVQVSVNVARSASEAEAQVNAAEGIFETEELAAQAEEELAEDLGEDVAAEDEDAAEVEETEETSDEEETK